jgi:ESCRT-I complex subunit VPS28
MDAIKLNMLANDQVCPLLQELLTSMARLGPMLPPDFEAKVKVKKWLANLYKMGAADELTKQQARQLNFGLNLCCFHGCPAICRPMSKDGSERIILGCSS